MLNRNYIIKEVTTEVELAVIRELAIKIWHIAYGQILNQEQIDYMLEAMYSLDTLQAQFRQKASTFLILFENEIPEGFAAYSLKSSQVLRIEKLYMNPKKHGRGFGRALIENISDRAKFKNIPTLELNVNRRNPAKQFYEKSGFYIVDEVDIPIGPYWMNDYVMRKSL